MAHISGMHIQNQIKRTLSEPDNIEYIRDLLENNEIKHRTELAKRACKKFTFFNIRGQAQIGGCLKALSSLEDAEHFTLPATRIKPTKKSPRRLSDPLPQPVNVPTKAGDVQDLKLIHVQTPEHMAIWNEIMIEEHPQGARPLVGRQIRYLIHSQQGWLGGFGFAAPALPLADRDQWIGWGKEQREKYLHFIVAMSRFLLRYVKHRN